MANSFWGINKWHHTIRGRAEGVSTWVRAWFVMQVKYKFLFGGKYSWRHFWMALVASFSRFKIIWVCRVTFSLVLLALARAWSFARALKLFVSIFWHFSLVLNPELWISLGVEMFEPQVDVCSQSLHRFDGHGPAQVLSISPRIRKKKS